MLYVFGLLLMISIMIIVWWGIVLVRLNDHLKKKKQLKDYYFKLGFQKKKTGREVKLSVVSFLGNRATELRLVKCLEPAVSQVPGPPKLYLLYVSHSTPLLITRHTCCMQVAIKDFLSMLFLGWVRLLYALLSCYTYTLGTHICTQDCVVL